MKLVPTRGSNHRGLMGRRIMRVVLLKNSAIYASISIFHVYRKATPNPIIYFKDTIIDKQGNMETELIFLYLSVLNFCITFPIFLKNGFFKFSYDAA